MYFCVAVDVVGLWLKSQIYEMQGLCLIVWRTTGLYSNVNRQIYFSVSVHQADIEAVVD